MTLPPPPPLLHHTIMYSTLCFSRQVGEDLSKEENKLAALVHYNVLIHSMRCRTNPKKTTYDNQYDWDSPQILLRCTVVTSYISEKNK